MMLPCDVYSDGTQPGQTNMDRDETMLSHIAGGHSRSMVRIYEWSSPTVSLGYFQRDDAEVDPRLLDCPRVKRVTGGGAILHDVELTYCCALPAVHDFCRNPVQVYSIVHTAIIGLLNKCGANCLMRQDDVAASPSNEGTEPFLCFLRSDPRDVVFRGLKVLGSAQRRRRGNILQHGSILLKASELTPELPGVVDLAPEFKLQVFREQLPSVVAHALADDVAFCNWPPSDSV